MKKLIKVSDYYYVVDDKAEIKEGNYFLDMYNKQDSGIQQCTRTHIEIVNAKDKGILCNKVIATTNFLLPLPQITNPSDDMVGKEVEVGFSYSGMDGHTAKIWLSEETSTNETLEEVAEKELKPMLCGNWNHNCFNNENLIDVWVAGYKHAESKMYSHSEMKQLITNAFVEMSDWKNEGKETRELEVLMEQWFNNNKK